MFGSMIQTKSNSWRYKQEQANIQENGWNNATQIEMSSTKPLP